MIDIEKLENTYVTKKENDAIRNFVWSIVVDRWLLKNKNKLFYNAVDTAVVDNYRVLSEKHFKMYKNTDYRLLQFKPDRWVIKEFFDNKPFTLELPVCPKTWNKDVHHSVLYYFLWPLAKEWIIDDLLYSIVRNLCTVMWVNYDPKTWIVWFGLIQTKKKAKAFWKLVTYETKDFTLEEVLNTEIEQGFISTEMWDPNRDFWYTHLLRQYAEFKLFEWSKRVLINWSKYNVLATSRWYGKTMLLAFIASRWLLDPRPGFWGRKYREIKLFVPDKENIWLQVMEYIKSMLWDMWTIKLANKKKAFEISKFSIKCNITWNIFKLISLYNFERGWELGTSLWEWLACDLALIDEAPRIPNSFWVSFHQRAAFETSEFFMTWTINKETPADHWFYKLLIDWEVWVKDIASYRLTIDENEVMQFGKTKEQRKEAVETVKAQLRLWWEKELYAKGYCIILEESNVFNLSWSICSYQPKKYADTDIRILWFDLWKLTDDAALVLINLTHREIEESRLLKNASYWTQLEYAQEYKEKYKNILIIWDRSWVGEAVAEQDTTWIVDTWIKSTWQGWLNYNKKLKYYTCSKGVIINNTASVLNNWIIKIPSIHAELLEQFNDFIKMKSWRWEVILYKWKWIKKDDLVLSTAYAILYMYSILDLKTIEDIELYCKTAWKYDTFWYNDAEETNWWGYYNWLY
jgi:hypothetical protein